MDEAGEVGKETPNDMLRVAVVGGCAGGSVQDWAQGKVMASSCGYVMPQNSWPVIFEVKSVAMDNVYDFMENLELPNAKNPKDPQ